MILEKIPAAFAVGLLSAITPCVLPLIPGYLAAISAVEADKLGERGAVRRVAIATIPFIVGFTVVFVVLGAGAAAITAQVPKRMQTEITGFFLIVFGLAFVGLLPWPERAVAPGLLGRARRRGSTVLLGGAFALCAAPCIGLMLGSVIALASNGGHVGRAIILLTAYSLGLGAAFLFVGMAFARAMQALRWGRDRFRAIQIASGLVLIVLGLLLFFHEDAWLRVYLNEALNWVDLGAQ